MQLECGVARRNFFFVLLALWIFLPVGALPQTLDRAPVVTHQDLRFRVFPKEGRLKAEARVTVENRAGNAQREIPLLLYRLFDVDAVTSADGAPLEFRQLVVKLSDEKTMQVNAAIVRLRAPLAPGAQTTFVVRYSGSLFGYSEVMAHVKDRVSEEYTLLRPDALVYPMVARPSFTDLHAAYDAVFTYTLEVTAPAGYIAASGGTLVSQREAEGRATFLFHSRVPTWRVDVAVARFKLLKNEAAGLYVYALPEDEAGAARALKAMERVIKFYSGAFGPSRRGAGYTAIEIPDGWGSQAGDFYFLQTAAAFRDPERLSEMYHEIAHSWNARPRPEFKRARWFDEAFASYFEDLAVRQFEGEKIFAERMERARESFRRAAQKDARAAETPIAEYGKHELGRYSYTKGAWSLHVLHTLVGDAVFRRIIQEFLMEFAERPAGFRDFQSVAQRVSGRDLSRFFNEWIFGAESSNLLLEGRSAEEIAARYR